MRWWLFLIFFLVAADLKAQTDSLPAAGWKITGRLGLDGNLQEGNLEQRMLRLSFAPELKGKQLRIRSFLQYRFNQVFGNVLQDDVFAYLSLDYPHDRRLYFNLSGMYENASLRFIEKRLLMGAGIAWKVTDKPQARLTLIQSAVYDETHFRINQEEGYKGLRYSLALQGEYSILKNKLRFSHDVFYQPVFQNFRRHQRLRVLASLLCPITKRLNMTVNADYIYESQVDATRKQANLLSSFGASFQW